MKGFANDSPMRRETSTLMEIGENTFGKQFGSMH
jgi:hypothetical protein